MFSVIIPLFNKSGYIEKALCSVFNQTFKDFEIIVVNDGSTDDGPEKVHRIIQDIELQSPNSELRTPNSDPDSYRDRTPNPIILLIDQPNSGVSTARNNGVKAARFDYIAFLDADDWWDTHFLEEMKGLIEQYPDAGMWGSNYYYVKNGKNRLEDKGLPRDFTSGYIDYFKIYASCFCVPINCSFVIVGKEIFSQEGGFNPALKFGEDLDLWIRIALKHKVAYLNKPLAYSNQDVAKGIRALSNERSFNPEEHVIFNTGNLDKEEKRNPDLKKLLDGLRTRSLVPFYMANLFPEKVKSILQNIDLSGQPLYYRFIYSCPKLFVRLFLSCRSVGSKIKRCLIYEKSSDRIRYQA